MNKLRIYQVLYYLSLGAYFISFFLPAFEGGWFIPDMDGYEAAYAAGAVLLEFDGEVWTKLPGAILVFIIWEFSNLGFMWILTIGKHLNALARLILGGLAILSSGFWWVSGWSDGSVDDLEIGYWVWHLSIIAFVIFDFLMRRAMKFESSKMAIDGH